MKIRMALLVWFGLLACMVQATEIEPTWESMAKHYQVPDWFVDGTLYAFVLAPPIEDIVIKSLGTDVPLDQEIESIALLGSEEEIHWKRLAEGLTIQRPMVLPNQTVIGFRISYR